MTEGMRLRVRNITFDCSDAKSLARFWAEALGWNLYYDDDPEVLVAPWFPRPDVGAPTLLFIPVPEGKTAKNRVHLDLSPEDGTRDEHVQRLLSLGATLVEDHRQPDGTGWAVLADPEGNELCVERAQGERAEPATRAIRLTIE
jgi:predicted enzyme related to lactoylglutathione lyase